MGVRVIPIPTEVVSHYIPISNCFIPIPMGFPVPLGSPWDSRSHWESHSHAHLNCTFLDNRAVLSKLTALPQAEKLEL